MCASPLWRARLAGKRLNAVGHHASAGTRRNSASPALCPSCRRPPLAWQFPAGPPPAGQFSGAAFVTPDPTAPQPELCHYVASALSPGDATAGALQAAVSGAAAAQNLTQAAASAWLDAAIGGTFFNASTGQW